MILDDYVDIGDILRMEMGGSWFFFPGWDVVSMVMTDRKNQLILIIAVQSMSG